MLHDGRVATILGIALGISFTVCFLTGLFSHWGQSTDPWLPFPARPAGAYRVTQTVHVFTGVASIPLLLAKLWTVLPRFFQLPPIAGVAHAAERLALVPLVGGSLFLLVTGLNNIVAWYPWSFGFVPAHHSAAWLTMGALIVHVGAKATTARQTLGRDASEGTPATAGPTRAGGLDRRSFLAVVGGTGVFLGASVGAQSIAPFEPIGLLSPRDLDIGPQGLPVNSTARRRGVTDAAMSPGYRLVVTGNVARELTFSLDELLTLPMHDAELPMTCVEGWSKSAHWRGVRLRDLLAMAGAPQGATCTVRSLQQRGSFRNSFVNENHSWDRDTLLAVELNGGPLHIDHGFPVRLIAPNRPGVNQTKWVREVRVT